MADFTASTAALNSSGTLNLLAAQASQTIDVSKADGQILLIAYNGNQDVDGLKAATISISPGSFMQSVLGTASLTVAGQGIYAALGPFESMRFKNTSSKITVGVAVTASGTVSSVKLAVINLPKA